MLILDTSYSGLSHKTGVGPFIKSFLLGMMEPPVTEWTARTENSARSRYTRACVHAAQHQRSGGKQQESHDKGALLRFVTVGGRRERHRNISSDCTVLCSLSHARVMVACVQALAHDAVHRLFPKVALKAGSRRVRH
jgi:hypothetical protein